jgi:hypothetical protein
MPIHFDPEVMRLLAAASFFQGLDQATLELVVQAATERIYAPDQLVILEGEPPADLFMIQWGWLKASNRRPCFTSWIPIPGWHAA